MIQELWFVLCFIFLVIMYPIIKIKAGLIFNKIELYILFLVVIIPIMAALPAFKEFGQPIIYGILSQRGVAVFGGVLLLFTCLHYQIVKLHELEQIMLFIAWGTFVLYALMKLFLDPNKFISYGNGFVSINDGSYLFKLQNYFIMFGLFYYTFRGFRKKIKKDYLIATILFVFMLGDNGGRGMTLAFIVTFLFYVFRWGGFAKFAKIIPKFSLIVILLLLLFYFVNPEQTISRIQKFTDAFTLALTGTEGEDSSANARLFQILVAVPYIVKHPFVGSGNISQQWQEGFEGVLGAYFHPSDIGLIGIVFLYGTIGFLFYSWQLKYAIVAANQCKNNNNNSFLDATKGILMYLFLYSVQTGIYVHYAEVTLSFIVILIFIINDLNDGTNKLIKSADTDTVNAL